jgi:hypothetical protein
VPEAEVASCLTTSAAPAPSDCGTVRPMRPAKADKTSDRGLHADLLIHDDLGAGRTIEQALKVKARQLVLRLLADM